MKKFLDILGILLPALIIVMGILRVFMKKPRGLNGLTFLFAVLLLLVGLLRFFLFSGSGKSADKEPKPVPVLVSGHSSDFNHSVNNLLSAYDQLSITLSSSHKAAFDSAIQNFINSLNEVHIDELQKDTLIYQTALQPYDNLHSIAKSLFLYNNNTLGEKKSNFNALSNELFSLLSIIRYDHSVVFWMECEHALGADRGAGNWLSRKEESINPYGIADCSEMKTKIDFLKDTTKAQ